jgi:hypothetical protein
MPRNRQWCGFAVRLLVESDGNLAQEVALAIGQPTRAQVVERFGKRIGDRGRTNRVDRRILVSRETDNAMLVKLDLGIDNYVFATEVRLLREIERSPSAN